MNKKTFLYLGVILILIILVIVIVTLATKRNIVSIQLTPDGFTPKEVRISRGQVVEFSTTTNTPFWPASNLHPTHEIYSEFDPKKPVDPKSIWEFTFHKKGSFEYHDHLAPHFRGTIIVN